MNSEWRYRIGVALTILGYLAIMFVFAGVIHLVALLMGIEDLIPYGVFIIIVLSVLDFTRRLKR